MQIHFSVLVSSFAPRNIPPALQTNKVSGAHIYHTNLVRVLKDCR